MSTSSATHRTYSFGEFTLDIDRGALVRAGADIKLRPKSFEMLRYLVQRHGRLVSKDELLNAIWGKTVVTDDAVTQCLIDVRKALGDTERKRIRTVPRRGYIFDAEVVVSEVSSAAVRPAASRRANSRAVIVSIAVAAMALIFLWMFETGNLRITSVPPDRSIAVLPFVDMSVAQDQRYLGDGLSEDILNSLAQKSELRVIARTSSFSFREQTPDVATIRDVLNVAYIVEGSIRPVGEQIRITVQLIDTADSSHVWSQAFERRPRELLAVQKDIAEQILRQILPDSEQTTPVSMARNMSANESMLLARYYEQEVREQPEVDEDILAEAIRLYRDATDADPDSALAHSRLAGALLYAGDAIAAEAPISRALKLDPDLSEVQDTLGKYNWLRGLPGAGTAWKRAIELNPNNADALSAYGYWYWMQGYDDGPEDYFRRALELDPLSLTRYASLGNFYAHEARLDEAQEIIERVQALFDSPVAYRLIARMLELMGRIDESIAWTIRARDQEPDNPAHSGALAEYYADIGDIKTALALEPEPGIGLLLKMRRYQDAVDVGEELMIDEPGDIYLHYLLAFAYNVTGQPADAVRILQSTGLPDTVKPEARQATDIEAYVTLVDALDAAGETQLSHELAEWWLAREQTESRNWWIHLYMACPLAVVGRHDEALERLGRIAQSPRLPWDFLVRDSQCFQQYANEPRYRKVLTVIELRQTELRDRLAQTLSKFSAVL